MLVELLRGGAEVVACDYAEADADLKAEAEAAGRVRWVRMDVSRDSDWEALPGGDYRALIHTAAVTAPESDSDPKRTADVNFTGTVNALEWAFRRGVPRTVCTSSSAVYRYTESTAPLSEEMCVDPRFTYGLTKIFSERYLSVYRENLGLDACSVRLPSMYGPRERPTQTRTDMSPVYHMARAVARGEDIAVSGADIARDWTYVGDAAGGLVHLCGVEGGPDVLNLSTGVFVPLWEIVEAFHRVRPGHGIGIVEDGCADLAMTGTSGGQPMNPDRLHETGFSAETGIDEGLSAYLEWLEADPGRLA